MYIFIIVFFFLKVSETISKEIPAKDLLIECNNVRFPETLRLQRAATINGYGYIFYKISPLAQAFIECSQPGKKLIEIGSGFSNVTEECLRRGLLEYTANDLSLEHLKILTMRLRDTFESDAQKYLEHLVLLPGKSPDVLSEKDNYYDAILIDKVLHFFTAQEANDFFVWTYKSLKPGGKLFLFTVSPYCKAFKVDKLLALYKNNKNNGDAYPGFVPNVHYYMNASTQEHPKFALPEHMTFFILEDLVKKLVQNKFDIDKQFILQMPTDEQLLQWIPSEEEICDLIGVIASKK